MKLRRFTKTKEEALAEGIRERNLELARTMIAEKLPLEQISRMLGTKLGTDLRNSGLVRQKGRFSQW